MRWDSVGYSSLACFAVGTKRLPPERATSLRTEAVGSRDLVLFANVADECVLSIPKIYAWWKHAASLLAHPASAITHVAKVDDDSFLHVPNLEHHLHLMSCFPRLVYGTIAFSGYSPATYSKCAFSWGAKGPYKKYRCADRGFHPPVPFATGPMQVLSSQLVSELAQFSAVSTFCDRAEALLDLGVWDKAEDTTLGFWLSNLPLQEAITFTHAEARKAHNLGCYKTQHLYRPPANGSVLIHFVKKPLGFQYIWRTLGGAGRPHDAAACAEMAGVA